MESRIKKRRKRRKKLVLFFVLLVTLASSLVIYNLYSDFVSAVDNMHKPLSKNISDMRDSKIDFDSKDPFSILLVGVDKREGDVGRTDSILVITINPQKNSTKILSIPRDTRTELVDSQDSLNNRISKINHAFAFGGIEMSIATVENFLNIPIDYYIEVSMEGFKDMVNAVGGIDVYNQYAFELDGVQLSEGQHHLNGEEALQYARMRKEDPMGDFGRQERQKEVVTKVIKQGASISSLTKSEEILNALENNIQTNLTFNDILGIQLNYRSAAQDIDKLSLEGEGQTFSDGGWYFVAHDEERQNISDSLRLHLNLKPDEVPEININ